MKYTNAKLLQCAEYAMECTGELHTTILSDIYGQTVATRISKDFTIKGAERLVYSKRPDLFAKSRVGRFCADLRDGVGKSTAARKYGIYYENVDVIIAEQRGKALPPERLSEEEKAVVLKITGGKHRNITAAAKELHRPKEDIAGFLKQYADTPRKEEPKSKEHKPRNTINHQLCWSCLRAYDGIGGCSWFTKRGTPVRGWDAEPTQVMGQFEPIDTYYIKHCPMYRHDPRYDEGRARDNEDYYRRT